MGPGQFACGGHRQLRCINHEDSCLANTCSPYYQLALAIVCMVAIPLFIARKSRDLCPGFHGCTAELFGSFKPLLFCCCFIFILRARAQARLDASLAGLGVPRIVHTQPFFGDPSDAPRRPTRSAGLEFRIPTAAASELPPFGGRGHQSWQQRLDSAAHDVGSEGDVQVGAEEVVPFHAQAAVPAAWGRNRRRLHRFTPARRCGNILRLI